MLKKIEADQVGCLDTFKSPELEKQVLVFGHNGAGKSTIAAVLRSLQLGQPEAIAERASLGSPNAKPQVELTFDGQAVSFEGGKWEGMPESPVVVFDENFVNRNVHSGDQHENEHKKSLYTVVLGDTCAQKLTEQAKLAEEIKDHNRRVKDLERDIARSIPGDIEFKEFVKLEPVEEINASVEKQKAVVDLFQKSQRLRDAAGFEAIELPRVSSSLAKTLAKTMESLSGDAEERVNAHLESATQGASTRWIEEGLKHQQGEQCPFCGESTSQNDLIKAYQDFFSEAYNGLKAEINSMSGLADRYFGESVMLKQQKLFTSNENAAEFWGEYLEVPPIDHSIFEEISDEMGECRDRVNEAIAQKQQNPLKAVTVDSFSLSDSLMERIEDYNTLVGVGNGRIDEVRESQNKGDLDQETRKLNLMLATQMRFSGKVKDLVSEWESAAAVKETNSAKRKDLQNAIEDETTAVFESQGEAINSVLEKMEANFKLSSLETNNRTKPPSVNLCVEICDKEFQLGDKLTGSQRPFRSTLSSAERTMLAFAFFVSSLQSDGDSPNKVIVLDDPITSFDNVRLGKTAEIVSESLASSGQLLVLSHSKQFLEELNTQLSDPQLLGLSTDDKGSSTLKEIESLAAHG